MRPSRAPLSGRGMALAQALAREFDAVGVVNDAVEDGVGEGGNANQVVPSVDWNLTGDDERSLVVTIFDDFEHISCLVGYHRLWSPIVQDEQFDSGDGSQQPGVTGVAMRDGQVGEQSGHAHVENGDVFSARLVAERAGEPALAQAACARYEEIAPFGDPIAGREFEEQRAVAAARRLIVDVLDAGGVTQLGDPGPCFKLLLSAQRQFVFEQQSQPFGVIETARFGSVFEFHESLSQAMKTEGFRELEHRPETRSLDHAKWLGLLLEYELTLRRQKQFETRARVAKLRHSASVEDVNYQTPRGLDRALFLKLSAFDWIAERRNLLVTGASGLGKSWLACALGHKACRENISVLYTRMPRLFADLAVAHGDARYARLLRSLARVKLLILDDWGPEALTSNQARDMLEIVEDRYDNRSLIITSQVPIDRWHDLIGVPTLADAILDRVVHNAYRIELSGESLNKRHSSS